MYRSPALLMAVVIGHALWGFSSPAWAAGEVSTGVRLDPSSYGPGVVETMAEKVARHRAMMAEGPVADEQRSRAPGTWIVPSRSASYFPNSGNHYVTNKWGDTRMGIGFPEPVDVQGAYFAGQGGNGAWTGGVRVFGYRDGVEVQSTDWFCDVGAEPAWFAMNLKNVDRMVILALPVVDGAGWYALDDLTFTYREGSEGDASRTTVVDFEDCFHRMKVTGSGHGGLIWETGAGVFEREQMPPAPITVHRESNSAPLSDAVGAGLARGEQTATLPQLVRDFQGVVQGDAGDTTAVADTMGAIGPNHYVELLNGHFAVFDRITGSPLIVITRKAFFPPDRTLAYDPRVLFDHHSGRWVVVMAGGGGLIQLAVSLSDDPTGAWFHTGFYTGIVCSNEGDFVDYPNLGVDSNGIYTAMLVLDFNGPLAGMVIFAIDKTPLLAPEPSLGTVTGFCDFPFSPFEGAVQPAHTYGTPAGEYMVSLRSSTALRVRRIDAPLTAPTLLEVGDVTVPEYSPSLLAPALGSTVPISTIDERPMMSVFRDGSLWTCHTVDAGGRTAIRWYEIDPVTATLTQFGTVSDVSLHYYMPSLMINRFGHVVLGMSGSDENHYIGAYYTGRRATDPPGEMAVPVLLREGIAPWEFTDGSGRSRWGDYSYTTLDPIDQLEIWTVQEYAHAENVWGTQIGVFGGADCNTNGVDDFDEIDASTSIDCNANNVPDECESNADCNSNGVQDICDIAAGTDSDCNANRVPDLCDIAGAFSADADSNNIADECEAPVLYVKADAIGANHGTTWADAYTDLEQARAVAALPTTLASEIWVAEGVYKPQLAGQGDSRFASIKLANGVALYGGFGGTETSRDQREPAVHPTVLSGDLNGDDAGAANRSENAYTVVTAIGLDASTVLDGFVVTGGQSDGLGSPHDRGGGMFVEGSTLVIAQCVFEDNFAAVSGGGLFNTGGTGPTINNCVFKDNSADKFGGGMFNNGSGPTLVSCRFLGNSATTRGGGFNNGKTGTATLVNGLFSGNSSNLGGALGNNGSPALINCTLSANTATSQGGGVYNFASSSAPVFSNCILWGNSDSGGMDQSAQINVLAGSPTVAYSDVQGWSTPGVDGNISSDPFLTDPDGIDNIIGTDDDDVSLQAGSPVIDAGNNAALPGTVQEDLERNGRFFDDPATIDTGNGPPPIVDIGAIEFSIGNCPNTCGDIDGSGGSVNLVDFATFALCFNRSGPGGSCPEPGTFACSDLDGNGATNLVDFATFSLTFGATSTNVAPDCP